MNLKKYVILASIAFALASQTTFSYPIPSTGTVDVYFSPNGGATDAITREIGKARQEILVQATRSPASL